MSQMNEEFKFKIKKEVGIKRQVQMIKLEIMIKS